MNTAAVSRPHTLLYRQYSHLRFCGSTEREREGEGRRKGGRGGREVKREKEKEGGRDGVEQNSMEGMKIANGVCKVGSESITQFVEGSFANNTSG